VNFQLNQGIIAFSYNC